MSLFQERQASAKKVVQLQNEIISLKQQLSSLKTSATAVPSKECEELKLQLKTLQEESNAKIEDLNKLLTQLAQEATDLKADLKKSRSETTRLKNKLKALEEDV